MAQADKGNKKKRWIRAGSCRKVKWFLLIKRYRRGSWDGFSSADWIACIQYRIRKYNATLWVSGVECQSLEATLSVYLLIKVLLPYRRTLFAVYISDTFESLSLWSLISESSSETKGKEIGQRAREGHFFDGSFMLNEWENCWKLLVGEFESWKIVGTKYIIMRRLQRELGLGYIGTNESPLKGCPICCKIPIFFFLKKTRKRKVECAEWVGGRELVRLSIFHPSLVHPQLLPFFLSDKDVTLICFMDIKLFQKFSDSRENWLQIFI